MTTGRINQVITSLWAENEPPPARNRGSQPGLLLSLRGEPSSLFPARPGTLPKVCTLGDGCGAPASAVAPAVLATGPSLCSFGGRPAIGGGDALPRKGRASGLRAGYLSGRLLWVHCVGSVDDRSGSGTNSWGQD